MSEYVVYVQKLQELAELAERSSAEELVSKLQAYDGADSSRFIEETCDAKGRSILHVASANGNVGVIRWIIENHPYAAKIRDGGGRTALHYAVEAGVCEAIQIILDRLTFEDVADMVDKGGQSPIHLAAAREDSKVLEYLTSVLLWSSAYKQNRQFLLWPTLTQNDANFELLLNWMSPEAVEAEIRSSNLIVIASAIPDHVVATNFVLKALKRTNCPNLIVEVVDDLDGQNLIHNAAQVGNFMLLNELKSIYPKEFQKACEHQDNVSNLSGFLAIYLPASGRNQT